jgi:hypothetical protein
MIKLKVHKPDQVDENNPLPEFVAQGIYSADLTQELVETDSREFADFLIANHNCEEVQEVKLTEEVLNKMSVKDLTEKAVELNIETPAKIKADLVKQILEVVGGAE